MKQKILDNLKKVWIFYQSIVSLINKNIQEDITKTVIILLLFAVFFFFFKSSLAALLLGSAFAVVFFRWDSRVFFGIALAFLVSCPIYLLLKDESTAENMAVYAYYLLAIGVIVQIIEHAREQKEIDSDKKNSALVNQSTVILLLLVIIIGFYYFNDKFSKQLTEQNSLIDRIGGYKVKEEDKEMTKMKEQIQEMLNLLATATDDKVTYLQTPTSSQGSIQILNGTDVKGLAGLLKDILTKKGYSVVDIGTEPNTYTETVIKFEPNFKDQAEALQKELENIYKVKLEETSGLEHDILIIIGQ